MLLSLQNITKSFGTVQALKGVDFSVDAGEVVVLLGENGAGKSTLLKCITGVHTPDTGDVQWQGASVKIDSPSRARALGIRMVYQELNLAPHLTVAENIALGTEQVFLNRSGDIRHAQQLLADNGLDKELSPTALVGSLSQAQRQLVEIAKALAGEARILLLDEPTSSLGEREIESLFTTIRRLKTEKHLGIVYVSHRLPECFTIGDRVLVLRDGQTVYESRIADTDTTTVVRQMVGRDLSEFYPRVREGLGEMRLPLTATCGVHAGEIVGIAGLLGSGRTELLEYLFGLRKSPEIGGILTSTTHASPRAAIQNGMALVTEDRKGTGLSIGLPIRHNVTLAGLEKIAPGPWLSHKRDKAATQGFIQQLAIKAPSTETLIGALSGGNQQKGVFARWLHTGAQILLLDEPTRGVDVGSKVEIYQRMNKLTQGGAAILLVSSELPELLGMSDRVLCLYNKQIVADLSYQEATAERVLHFITTGKDLAPIALTNLTTAT
jgi:ABC-type sugar transport system ATPase subunit